MYADNLLKLAENAYTDADYHFNEELAKDFWRVFAVVMDVAYSGLSSMWTKAIVLALRDLCADLISYPDVLAQRESTSAGECSQWKGLLLVTDVSSESSSESSSDWR